MINKRRAIISQSLEAGAGQRWTFFLLNDLNSAIIRIAVG